MRPRAEILTIGTEIVTGSTVNTNAAHLGMELTKLGFEVTHQSACRDAEEEIHEALRLAMSRAEVILACGGLGPTADDVTRESIANFFGVPLRLSKRQYQAIERYYRQRGRRVPHIVKQEAYFPDNAMPVFNRFGVALGFIIEEAGRILMVLPGVPGELIRLFDYHLKPFLKRKFPSLTPKHQLIVKTIGVSEPILMRKLGLKFFQIGRFQFGIYPEAGEVDIRIYADSSKLVRRLRSWIVQRVGRHIYSLGDETIETVIGKTLIRRGGTLSVAESCTGGEVAARVTVIPGASLYFKGGIVAYQNEAKTRLLDVPAEVVHSKGAVSKEAALAMARGVRRKFKSTLSIGVTGIAGPTGGSAKKPVGLVYIAIDSDKGHGVWEERFEGDRQHIQERAVQKALEYLWRWIREKGNVAARS